MPSLPSVTYFVNQPTVNVSWNEFVSGVVGYTAGSITYTVTITPDFPDAITFTQLTSYISIYDYSNACVGSYDIEITGQDAFANTLTPHVHSYYIRALRSHSRRRLSDHGIPPPSRSLCDFFYLYPSFQLKSEYRYD